MALGNTVGATCARITSLDAVQVVTAARTKCRSWHASVSCAHPEPGLRVWEYSTDHCWKQRHTTNTLCPTCAAIRQYVHPASRRPTMQPCSNGWNCSKRVCTRQRGMVVPYSECCKHCSPLSSTVPACRVTTEGDKTGLLSAIWSPMTVTNEQLALQPLSMHILFPSANEHSPWGCCIFSGSIFAVALVKPITLFNLSNKQETEGATKKI